MRRMTLCKNCHTIQKVGTTCGICKCPVKKPIGEFTEDLELESRKHIVSLGFWGTYVQPWKCTKCHHEWQATGPELCAWCGAYGERLV